MALDITESKPVGTAVLFLVFNRFDTTKKIFAEIRKARPTRLYIASDGARVEKEGEQKEVSKIREYIETHIDWECEAMTLYQDANLGCKLAVSGAIDWFFQNEEPGIILEDDCLPSQHFFQFCSELLAFYRDDMRVAQISGTNVLGKGWSSEDSYHFSSFGSIWGWATWRNRWALYDVNMKTWPTIRGSNELKQSMQSSSEYLSRSIAFQKTYEGQIDTWDYQWIYARLINRMMIIIPCVNLITNIGFGVDATHTKDVNDKLSEIEIGALSFPLLHPQVFMPNASFEKEVHRRKPGFSSVGLIARFYLNSMRFLWAKK